MGGMMVISGDVAINGRASRSSWGHARLSPADETADALGFPVGLLFAEHPIRRFGEMPSYGPNRLRVALPPGQALIEATRVAVGRPPAMQTDRVRRCDECPVEIQADSGRAGSNRLFPPLACTAGVVPA